MPTDPTGEGAPLAATLDPAPGAAVYSRLLLAVYDLAVLGLDLRVVFRCPARRILELYDRNVSDVHLDVGVGTGWFLDRCTFPVARPEIHLADLNPNCLAWTSRRIRRHAPVAHRWNVLEPFDGPLPRFGSIAISNLLHCLPGTMPDKERVFRNLRPLLRPGGVLFGATVLGKGVDGVGRLYRVVNRAYNRRAVFSNLHDGAPELDEVLGRTFARHALTRVGALALFTAHA
ncbi:MAG TPA: class I SAM-dependent methyltransferase [Anaeromyxobacter sp.]|nr:class I SAM-dependent methyltransferase [Anaeromyxobacter sp.]